MNLIAALLLAIDPSGQPQPDVVLLDFTAGYCAPCQQMVPMLQRMEKDKFPIRKIDITQQPDISRQYKVDRIPTLILLVEGKEQKRFVGLTSEAELRQAMNDAARKLDAERRPANRPADVPSESPESPAASETSPLALVTPASEPEPEPESSSGLRGVLDRVRRGFGGGSDSPKERPAQLERPDFRAQSPEGNADTNSGPSSTPMQTTVRVRVIDGKLLDFGTGTLIHSAPGQSIVATCAHLFQEVGGTAAVVVDIFRDGQVFSYPAKVLGGDHEADVAVLQIQNKDLLPVSPVAWKRAALQKDEAVFSIGCSNGDLPTQMNVKVVEVNRYIGPANVLCTQDPSQGRSGGGLFDTANNLIGICSAADRKAKEGLYAGIPALEKLMTQLKLTSLFDKESASFDMAAKENPAQTSPPGPFDDQDVFEQMFDELTDATTPPVSPKPNALAPPSASLPDPFAPVPTGLPEQRFAEGPPRSSGVSEITVIIDSKDPSQGKQVIVIPKPSPWLMELLTGDAPAGNLATARQQSLSNTSSRASRQRTLR